MASRRGSDPHLWSSPPVDQYGVVLDILVQSRRDQHAAERVLRHVIDAVGYEPRVVITDKLASNPPAIMQVLPDVDHRRSKGLNNRAENSHLPARKRERVMQRFKSTEHVQSLLLTAFGLIGNNFRPRRHRLSASQYRLTRAELLMPLIRHIGERSPLRERRDLVDLRLVAH